ncbi:hypothetical protein GW17_00005479 [Ensete ventricosum]|nr:hypothetical protein GW17_00005479 [Ensete ventricosum]
MVSEPSEGSEEEFEEPAMASPHEEPATHGQTVGGGRLRPAMASPHEEPATHGQTVRRRPATARASLQGAVANRGGDCGHGGLRPDCRGRPAAASHGQPP